MQAEVPQPISSLPARWGMFTIAQMGWLALAALPPYLGLRIHLDAVLVLAASAPWVAAAMALAFGRREGRRLDAFAGDWCLYLLQARSLTHPGDAPDRTRDRFQAVDQPVAAPGQLRWSRL
ncbi:MAG: hypothetical protein HKL89_06995 [Candidatus Dormibacteraeota bacterium]|nr:hypothetical protein [Candidatus Dormibacteraeota bacterium]